MTTVSSYCVPLPIGNQPSKSAIRAALVAIVNAANLAGWTIRNIGRARSGRTYYLRLAREDAGKVAVRISDHVPSMPVGGGKGYLMLAIVGVRSSVPIVCNWLASPTTEGGAA